MEIVPYPVSDADEPNWKLFLLFVIRTYLFFAGIPNTVPIQ